MKIKLLEALRLAPDGVHVQWYAAGTVLECAAPLAQSLLKEGLACAVETEAKKETKMLDATHEKKVVLADVGKKTGNRKERA